MLLLVLKPANRVSELLHAYEAACSKDPGNEELMQGLFACHVRYQSMSGINQAINTQAQAAAAGFGTPMLAISCTSHGACTYVGIIGIAAMMAGAV